jgi:seryl-tRNA synthetase
MTDKTTMGITAEPEEVEAVLNNLCGYHLAERDPVFRYTVLTREQVLYDALVTAIKRERGRALAELVASGHKLTEVAELTGLGTRQRVQRLIQLAKAAEQAATELATREVASRDFDERLAAVEATLDEVVSGLLPTGVDANEMAEVVNEPAPAMVGAMVMAEVSDDFAEVIVADDRYSFESTDEFLPIAEPTQVIPTLAALPRNARELPAEELPWWRRSRDTGAA